MIMGNTNYRVFGHRHLSCQLAYHITVKEIWVSETLYFLSELTVLYVPNEDLTRSQKPTQKVRLNLMRILQLKSTKLDPTQSDFTSNTRGKFVIDLKLPLNTPVWKNRTILAVF